MGNPLISADFCFYKIEVSFLVLKKPDETLEIHRQYLPQFHNDEHNSSSPNHNPQRHNYPELCMFGFVPEYLNPQPTAYTST